MGLLLAPQALHIRRAERKLVNLVHRDPADVIMRQFLWDTFPDGRIERRQMDS